MSEASPLKSPPRSLPNPMAKASLVMGIVAMNLFVIFAFGWAFESLRFLLPLIIIPYLLIPWLAIILAKVSLGKISRSVAEMEGYRYAKSGLRLGALTIIFSIGFTFVMPSFAKVSVRGNQSQSVFNCKQIITTLKLYAADNNGMYPDAAVPNARTSNEVFRELFKADVADSEAIFGSPISSDGKPDGNIGKKPDFSEALKPGENHWAMTKGITDSDPGNIPLVYESPADATWPPTWNPDFAGTIEEQDTGCMGA